VWSAAVHPYIIIRLLTDAITKLVVPWWRAKLTEALIKKGEMLAADKGDDESSSEDGVE